MSSSTLESTGSTPESSSDTLRDGPTSPTGPAEPPPGGIWRSLRPLIVRLHFYAGILVGPFLLVAAVTGIVYAFSPTVENTVYRQELFVDRVGDERVALSEQVRAVRAEYPRGEVQKVIVPGPADGTTRVVLADEHLPEGTSRTVFVDPYTTEIRGDLETRLDTLPLSGWLGQMHSSLHLGDVGRVYSETAASWLWVVALGGLSMWVAQVARTRGARRLVVPNVSAGPGRRRTLSWHGAVGTIVALGLVGLSATGLTWSLYAGGNITELRSALSWQTPAVDTTLPHDGHDDGSGGADGTGDHEEGEHAAHDGEHAAHGGGPMAAGDEQIFGGPGIGVGVDGVLAAARFDGLRDPLEIVPATGPGQAWTAMEVRSSWPTQRDAVAVDAGRGMSVERLDFAEWSMPAKLARWGIDAHMGLLFGLVNQIVLAVIATGLIILVILGYRMWWQRRPRGAEGFTFGPGMPRGGLRRAPVWLTVTLLGAAAALGWFLPLFGIPLAVFLLVDLLLAARARRAAVRRAGGG